MKKLLLLSLGLVSASYCFADATTVSQSVSTSLSENSSSPTMAVITTTRTTLNVQNAAAGQSLFAGQAAGCVKPTVAGDPDCCATSGWGTDSSLNECTAGEKALVSARNAGLTTYIGDSCIQNSNGACAAPISVYCVFPDKASYQMQEQGKYGQLGGNFGTPDQPNCSGLTQQQIQQIDLTKINFTSNS